MSETTCPVFYPDGNDLDDLCTYIQSIEKEYPGLGICKLVPPQNWYNRTYNLDKLPVVIDTPIRQAVSGQRGSYHVISLELKGMTIRQFETRATEQDESSKAMDDTERAFWRSIGKGTDAMYGADIEGSLFQGADHDRTALGQQGWTLDNALKESDLLRLLPEKIPGVNTMMLYVGMWRAMFAFHVEDLDLYSINYLHSGAPKSWYSILPERRARLEAIAEGSFAEDLRRCREYMRHKTKMFSPSRLKECGLPFDTVVQIAGEFVVTFPGAYHAGFNHGFNIAEATNFATPGWLPLGKKARRCLCRPHSVHIDVSELDVLYQCKLAREAALHPPTIVLRTSKSTGDRGKHAARHGTDTGARTGTDGDCGDPPDKGWSAERANKVTIDLSHSPLALRPPTTVAAATTVLDGKDKVIDLTEEDDPGSRCQTPRSGVGTESEAYWVDCGMGKGKLLGKRRVQPLNYMEAHDVKRVGDSTGLKLVLPAIPPAGGGVRTGADGYSDQGEDIGVPVSRPEVTNLKAQLKHHKHHKTHKTHKHHKTHQPTTKPTQRDHHRGHTHKKAVRKGMVTTPALLQGSSDEYWSEDAVAWDSVHLSKAVKQGHKRSKHHRDSVKDSGKGSEGPVPAGKGDVVAVVGADSYLQHTVGVITAVEGDLGRLHVKGQPRHTDAWMPLQHCHVIAQR